MNNGNMMPAGKDRPQRTVTRVPLIAPLPRRKKVAAYARVSVEKDASLAGYARVSTDSDEQENSYEAQVDYFTEYIQSRDEWEFVKIYTEEEHSYPALFRAAVCWLFFHIDEKWQGFYTLPNR